MHLRLPHANLAAMLLIAGPALAQQPAPAAPSPVPGPPTAVETLEAGPPQPPALTELVKQPAWQAAVTAAARAQFSQVPGSCAAASYRPTGDLTVYQVPSFASGPDPVAGMWAEKVSVTGCGPARTLNVLTVAKPGSAPDRIPMMPGTSHADPLTQRSALQYAQAIASRASPPNCRQQSFVGAEFSGYTGLPSPDVRDGRDGRPWQEDWLLYACGAVYGIKLQFTPNGQGTQLAGSNPVRIGGGGDPAPAAGPGPAPARRR